MDKSELRTVSQETIGPVRESLGKQINSASFSDIEDEALQSFQEAVSSDGLRVYTEDRDRPLEFGHSYDEMGCLDPVDQTEKSENLNFSNSVISFWGGEVQDSFERENKEGALIQPEYAFISRIQDGMTVLAYREPGDWSVEISGSPYGLGDIFEFGEDVTDQIEEIRDAKTDSTSYKLASNYTTKPRRGLAQAVNEPLKEEGFRVDSNGGAMYQANVGLGRNHLGFEAKPTKPVEAAGGIIAEALGVERMDMMGRDIEEIAVILEEDGLKRTFHELISNPDVIEYPLDKIDMDSLYEKFDYPTPRQSYEQEKAV